MAGRNDISIKLNLDAKQAKKELADARKATEELEDSLEDTESAGKALARIMDAETDRMISEIDATRRAVDAMDQALGDAAEFTGVQVVAELKRWGITAEEIEADVDALAASMKKAGNVKLHATAKGFDDVDQAVRRADDGVGDLQRRGEGFQSLTPALRGFTDEMGAGAQAAGVAGQAIGDLGDVALITGERFLGNSEKAAKLGTALGAAAIAIVGVGTAYSKIVEEGNANKALNAEEVNEYTEAVREAESAIEAVRDVLREQAGIDLTIFGEELDVTRGFNELGLSAQQAARLIADGGEEIDRFEARMRDAGVSGKGFELVLASLRQEAANYAKGAENAAAAQEFFNDRTDESTEAMDKIAESIDLAKTNIDRFGRDGTEAMGDVEDATDDVGDALNDVVSDLDRLSGRLDRDLSWEQWKGRALEFIGSVREGVALSKADVLEFQQSIIDAATELGNVPDEVTTDLVAQFDDGATEAEIQRTANILQGYANRNPITFRAVGVGGGFGGAGAGGARPSHTGSIVPAGDTRAVTAAQYAYMTAGSGGARVPSNEAAQRAMGGGGDMRPVNLTMVVQNQDPAEIEAIAYRAVERLVGRR